MWPKRQRRRVLRSWRVRRAAAVPVLQGEAAAALARRKVRRRRLIPAGRRLRALAAQPARLLAAASAAGLLVVLGWAIASGSYRIRGASVSGNVRISAPAVYAASGLDGVSVFTVDEAEAARRVMALDGVRAARVKVALPSRAAIVVEESRPVLLWQAEGVTLAVDETGLAVPPPLSADGLVPVRDLGGTLRAPGDRITPQQVSAALAFGARFGVLLWRPETGFSATSPEGWEVRLGSSPLLAPQQLDLLGAMRRELSSRGQNVAFIDLRFVHRPYYRLRGEGE